MGAHPAIRHAIQETAAVAHAVATIVGGGIIPIGEYEWMTVMIQYVKGDETSVDVYPTFLDLAGGIAAQWQTWSAAAGNKTATANTLRMTASGAYEETFDVRGKKNAVIYEIANGGTPTGTLEIIVILKGNAAN